MSHPHPSSATQGHGDGHSSHGGTGTYMAVFVGLLVLTVVSYWLGNSSIKDTAPAAAWAGMMAVSTAKAMLVILFFMHLKWEANWKYVLTIPSMMMSVFLICMLIPDVGMRIKRYSEERMIHAAMLEQASAHGAGAHGNASHEASAAETGTAHGEH